MKNYLKYNKKKRVDMGVKIDLHIHSNKSDGELSPFEIVDMAKNNGVKVMSITDHDTLGAYSPELFEYSEKQGVKLITGIEISTKHEKGGFHVLGYNIDIENEELLEELKQMRNNRKDYLVEVAEKLKEFGFLTNVSELQKVESVTKANVASDILNNPLNEMALKEYFGYIPTRSEFITTLLLKGCPAYIRKPSVSPKRAVDLIRKAGGKAVFAHPVAYFYDKGTPEEDTKLVIEEVCPDGIETNYIHYDKKGVKRNESDKWSLVAEKIGAFKTIGSDFHKNDGSRSMIGFVGDDIVFSEDQIEDLLNDIYKK